MKYSVLYVSITFSSALSVAVMFCRHDLVHRLPSYPTLSRTSAQQQAVSSKQPTRVLDTYNDILDN